MANITGTNSNDTLFGTAYSDVINGLAGADSMAGGKGGDIYYVDHAGDTIAEAGNGGYDTIYSSIDISLAAAFDNIEKVVLKDGALDVHGNGLNNTLVGNSGENSLRGDGGNDTLVGGNSNDFYIVETLGDKIVEKAGEGHDEVMAMSDYSLAAFAQVEDLHLKGGTYGTGNALNNIISGNSLDNVLNGGLGADTMSGGAGNDTYHRDNLGDVITENSSSGIHDLVISTVVFNAAISEVEDYDFSKLAGGVTFTGSAADNVIKGGKGIDTLTGLDGNDTYHVNSKLDVVLEQAGAGSDFVATGAFSIDLATYGNVEHAKLTGALALNATGTGITNVLIGNDGANVLNGLGGADTMIGGKGSDTYYVDNAVDKVTEAAGQGVDTIVSSVYQELGANVENLILAAGAGSISGVGNELKNLMVGNEGKNALAGGVGADTMKGGTDDDTYYVENAGDKVVELANQGSDAVVSAIDFSLVAAANVETLRLEGNAIKGTGNALNNRLIGNDMDNVLNGGGGADELWGGKGNDTYYFDNKGDSLLENGGEGTDTVVSAFAFANVLANVENYDFSKVAAAVNFTGDSANNVIKGGAAVDTLAGGLGDDTYHVNSSKDVIVELPGGGNDTVVTSNLSIDLSKYANVENATIVGTAALRLTGVAAIANTLTGNNGANVLDGKGGNDFGGDTLIGGKGNDTYMVRGVNDAVSELDGQGIDTVISTVSHTLADYVEKLTLAVGAGNINAIGNGLNNTIVGNAGANSINGGAGADTMKGGQGNDEYLVDDAGDRVVELAGQGHDVVYSSVDFSLASLVAVEDLALDGLSVNGTGNALANHIWGNWANNILNGGLGADTLEGSTGYDKYYIDNLGDVIIEDFNGGEGDTVYSTVALSQGFANVEHYDFTNAVSAVNFTASDEQNLIWSSHFADTLTGGKGSDVYFVNNSNDKVVELAGEGFDTVYATANVTKLWDNVERLMYEDSWSTAAWNATGNDQDNGIFGNAGNNILNGGKGNDEIFGEDGNNVLTGGEGADTFGYQHVSGMLAVHDIITDFDGSKDILGFWMTGDADGDGNWGEYEDAVSSVVDLGAGKNVVAQLTNGGSITFAGCGTGMVDHLADLVADPTTQLHIV